MKTRQKRRGKRNNEGFSLVEVLLSITILAIVTSTVFAFILVSTRMFHKANLEIEMQSEAQIMKNYMNDLVTDTAIGVEFYDRTMPQPETPQMDLFQSQSCLVIYGEDSISYMAWMKDSRQVHYLKKEEDSFVRNENGEYEVSFTEMEKNAASWPVMAKYVTNFYCDLEHLKEEHRIFSAVLEFELKEIKYATTHTIALRNEIFYEGRVDNYVDGEMGSYEEQITRITLTPGTIDKVVDRIHGTTVTYTHTVLAIGDIDTGVIYSVEGNSSPDTGMQENVLFIAPDETSSTLTVICKAKADENISTTAIVNIADVSAINILPEQEPNYKKNYYYPKTVIDFKAVVEGDLITPEGSGVIWELEAMDPSARIMEMSQTTCKVNVGNELNQTLILRAISMVDSNVMAEYVIYTADIEIGEMYITAEDGMYVVKRGDTLQLQVLINGQNMQPGMSCNWRILENPLAENKLSIDNQGRITATKGIPYNKEYKITVEAAVTDTINGGETKTTTCAVWIDKVDISFEPGYAIVTAIEGNDSVSRVKVYVKGLKVDKNEINIQQRPYVRGLQYWIVEDGADGDYGILALSMQEEKIKTEYTALRVYLKGQSSVYSDLPVYFYKWNMLYNGKYAYVPVPGDNTNLIEDGNKDGIPDTQKDVKINNVTYGYKNITVNGIMYHYYVDKMDELASIEWYLRVGNDSVKYTFDETQKQYVSILQ